MLVLGVNPGHDGAVTAVKGRNVLFAFESEKDSNPRHAKVAAMNIFDAVERIGEIPDVIAYGGMAKEGYWFPGARRDIGVGYVGSRKASVRQSTFCGVPVTIRSSSHIRSHIMMAVGMAPPDDVPVRAVLVMEGADGSFYLLDRDWQVIDDIAVLPFPGGRYALLFAIADPGYADRTIEPYGDEAGKLMALAAYGDPAEADASIVAMVDRLLGPDGYGRPKGEWKDSPVYNIGVEADVTKTAAALLQQRMFDVFSTAARKHVPAGVPLYISGGCGLNCDWNTMWRELGHFSSVFVPPVANDAGAALGHAIEAIHAITGDPHVEWGVYCGLDFEWDADPDTTKWEKRPVEDGAVADELASGAVVAWVQGRYEMGPRALGNRSLLAEPFHDSTRDRLNEIKQREGYRPIAPCCRIEDAGRAFDRDFPDPYMLYFRMVRSPDLKAITHVDGSARVQTVSRASNERLHDLLSTFADRYGIGVLCNTSLNYKKMGFINCMSDLAHYCETRGVADMVVGDAWFQRTDVPVEVRLPLRASPVARTITATVPEDATVVVMSQGLEEMLELSGRRGWHFPCNDDGSFQGAHPADSDDAIAQLRALQDKGASHLAIPKGDFWWLESYDGFREYLEGRCQLLLQNGTCMIFALEEGTEWRMDENSAARTRRLSPLHS